ncbi:hypothetical protein [Roseovarius aestuariivivens]|uniref:hypothetical protein n=1 Tax=Roseovarius aestuariivivens TaxID=1888910 RepID=UPI00108088CD|nr:hypothetical protein [Roseovarius aestuariivivens]
MRALKVLFLAALLPLAGCMNSALAPGGGAKAMREMPLYGGRIVVRGPEGYCIDPASRRRQSSATLVFLASCEALTGQRGFRVDPALMTVTVTPRRPGTEQPTARGIARAMAPKQPLSESDENGLAIVHFNTGGDGALPGGDPRYWRGGMALNGHLVSLAVYGPDGSRIAGPGGRALLRGLAAEIRRASTVSAPAPGAARARQGTRQDPYTQEKKPRGLGALLGGLFPNSG